MIIISIVKVAAVNTMGKQVDTTWGVFWLQAEAAVAVMAVSATMFRSLFLADGIKNRPQHKSRLSQLPTAYTKLWTKRTTAQADFPTIPSATYSLGTMIKSHVDPHGSEDTSVPMQDTDILVTRDFSMQVVRETKRPGSSL